MAEENKHHRFSAIDIGSNAIRMIVGEERDGRLIILKKLRAPIRLGQDVFLNGKISNHSQTLAEEAFLKFAQQNRKYKVKQCLAVATSATREATNRSDFVDHIKKSTGIQIQVIDGIEEARLIHQAVQAEVDLHHRQIMAIDIGGGSVEITFSKNGELVSTQSFPMGTVRILDKLKKRNLSEKEIGLVIGEFVDPIHHFIESQIDLPDLDFAVGTGGNLECMGNLKLQVLRKTPNTYLTLKELVDISNSLKQISVKDRIEKLGLRADRADVILPAIMVVKLIMRQAGVERILIPGVGLRDGLLWRAMKNHETQ